MIQWNCQSKHDANQSVVSIGSDNVVEDELKSVLCAVWPLIGLGGGGDIDNDSECRSVICAVSPIILITRYLSGLVFCD